MILCPVFFLLHKQGDSCEWKSTGEANQTKDSRAGFGSFFVFLWNLFFFFLCWTRLYCDSCPHPVRITSPGTHSSSRAQRSCRPPPFFFPTPYESTPVTPMSCTGHRFICLPFALSFVTDATAPFNWYPPQATPPLRSSSEFHGIQGTVLPPSVAAHRHRTCWSQESWRSAKLLRSDSLPEYTTDQRRSNWGGGKKMGPKFSQRGSKSNPAPS